MAKTTPRRNAPPHRGSRRTIDEQPVAGGDTRVSTRPRPGAPRPPEISRSQVVALAVVVTLLVALSGGYVLWAMLRPSNTVAAAPATPSQLAAILAQPHLLFIEPSGGDVTKSQLDVAPLANLDQRAASGISCVRAYYAAGRGLCAGTTFQRWRSRSEAQVFDSGLQKTSIIQMAGMPSRVRISPNGKLAATTVFVVGDGYASMNFSTRTTIYDLDRGTHYDLENLFVTKDGNRIQAPDFNFWGVTFEADSDGFYATLGTGGHTYLIHGRYSAHSAAAIRDGMECPSLSPDGKHIAYKSLVSEALNVTGVRTWNIHVLDLATMRDRALGETRNVDDQVEWLDNAMVIYGIYEKGPAATFDANLWSLGIDPSAKPIEFLRHASSPAVVRG